MAHDTQSGKMQYAKEFTISQKEGYRDITVRNPWDTTTVLRRYALVKHTDTIPSGLDGYTVVRVPITELAISSAVDAGAISMLGATDDVVAVCEPKYIGDDSLTARELRGEIADLGRATRPSAELLLASGAQGIIVAPFNNQGFGAVEKSGIPIIECASYTENTPLGRAEWIKFYAAFVGKEAVADSIFSAEVDRYNQLCELAKGVEKRPRLLAGMRYGQMWNISTGNSYAAHLYRDAQADYPWSQLEGAVSVPMSFEAVAVGGAECDVWIIPYYDQHKDMTLESLKEDFELYSQLAPYKTGEIYVVNTAYKKIYEQTPFAPALFLEDLLRVLHPQLFTQGQMRYFSKIK